LAAERAASCTWVSAAISFPLFWCLMMEKGFPFFREARIDAVCMQIRLYDVRPYVFVCVALCVACCSVPSFEKWRMWSAAVSRCPYFLRLALIIMVEGRNTHENSWK